MLNFRQKVMEDLDALLADLQSTTAHISSFQQQVERDQANQRSNTASSQSSPRNSTPSPLPPPPSGEQVVGRTGVKQHIIQENSSHQQQQHSYSSERVSSGGGSTATYHQERSSSSSTHSQSSLQGVSPVQYNSKPLSANSSNNSVGPNNIGQMSSTVNSNLSELDQLLQDLNSAQFIDQVNRRNASTTNQNQMVNGNSQRVVSAPVPPSPTSTTGQPPVGSKNSNRCQMDALLHELENVVPPPMGEVVFNTRAAAVIDAENVPKIHSQAPYFPNCDPADIDASILVYPFESGIDVRSFSQSSVPLEIECLQGGKIIIPLLDENSSTHKTTESLETNQAVQSSTVLVEVSKVEEVPASQVENDQNVNDSGIDGSLQQEEKIIEKDLDVAEELGSAVLTENEESKNDSVQAAVEAQILVESEIAKIENAVVSGESEPTEQVIESPSPKVPNFEEKWVAVLYEPKEEIATFPEEFDLPEEQVGLETSKESLETPTEELLSTEIINSKEEVEMEPFKETSETAVEVETITSKEEVEIEPSKEKSETAVDVEIVTSKEEVRMEPSQEVSETVVGVEIVTTKEEVVIEPSKETSETDVEVEIITTKEELEREPSTEISEIAVEVETAKEVVEIEPSLETSETVIKAEIVTSKEEVEMEPSKESDLAIPVQVETSKEESLVDATQPEPPSEESTAVPVIVETSKEEIISSEKYIPIPVQVGTSEEEGVIVPIQVETSKKETPPAPVEVEIPIAQEIRVIVARKDVTTQNAIRPAVQADASIEALAILPKSNESKLPSETTTAESAVSSSFSSSSSYLSAMTSSVAQTSKAPVPAPPVERPRVLPIECPIFVDVSHSVPVFSRPPPPPPSQTITRSLGGSSPPVPPFPVFLNLDGIPSSSNDSNYTYQSSEYKTSSSTTSTLDRESTLGRDSTFSMHSGHMSAFTPLQPMAPAMDMPNVTEQQHSSVSSHSYSKTESKSEAYQQSKSEHSEQYEASSSSFSSSSYSSQQQVPQPHPQLMEMDQSQMNPPAAFPLPPNYEVASSEQSHIYKKIERNEPAKTVDGSPLLLEESQVTGTGQEIPILQQFESSVSEQQSQALSEQQSSLTSGVTERTSISTNVETEASSASTTTTTTTTTTTAEIASTTTTSTTSTSSSRTLHSPPSPAPAFSQVFSQLRKNSGEYDSLAGYTQVTARRESDDYDLANSSGFQTIEGAEESQNSLEWQSRQMSGTSSAVTSTQQQQQMNSQSYVQNAYPQSQSHYQEIPTHAPQTASTATRELDELMASLSEFRMTNRDTPTTTQQAGSAGGDPAYAKPQKNRSPVGAATPAAAVNMGSGGAAAHGDQLDSMLGSLQSDMNRQGVSTKTKGLCAACNKPVVSQMITALGKVWHVEHFTCAHCKMTLGTMSFYERESKAYCEQDYHNLFAPRCAYCSGPITDKCVTALDKTWHPEHFFCGFCGCNFGDQGFHERDGQAYCREDFLKMFAPKCGGCGQPINDSYISALNRHWHPECFVCWDCQRPFGNMSFFDHDGLPYCEQHYHAKRGSLCADCQQPITGPSIIAMGRKFHPKHFTCAFCLKQLNNVTFKEQNNKPYCHPCFSKLFAGTKMMD